MINGFEHIGTDCVHAGFDYDQTTGAVMPSISLSTTFKQKSPGVPIGAYEYSRSANPTRDVLEAAIAKLEGAEFGLAFASGCMAMTVLAHLVKPGGSVVMINDVYGGTNRLFTKVAPSYGLDVQLVAMTEPEAIRQHITPSTRMVWIESPTNPTLMLADIRAISSIIRSLSQDIILVVDNTFLSPVFQRPLDLGADVVLHSATKYLNGHCDIVMGLVVTRSKELAERIAYYQNAIGGIPSPFDCYMVVRGMKTLHLRMERHGQNALKVAEFLEKHPRVEKVLYPGLPSHPQHELARRQQRGFGGMLAVVLSGTKEQAAKFTQTTRLFTLAESLGGVESLIEIPAIMTHGSVSAKERQALGITDTFLRLSVGIEDAADLVADLERALEAVYG